MITKATAALVATRLQHAPWSVKSEVMTAALTARDDGHFWELLNVRADPDVVKVGPKGYIHGWIFVGAPGVGAEVFHPHHGKGVVTRHDGKHATVRFQNGETRSFEAREGKGSGKLTERAKVPHVDQEEKKTPLKGGDLKREQDERIRAATHERMEHEKETTREHQRIMAGAPGGKAAPKDSDTGDYEKARQAADRYDATSPSEQGSNLRPYNDPEKQKEAIRLHTVARRLAPDAKAKKHHTDAINRHKNYLKQIENNQNVASFNKEERETRIKIGELSRRNTGSDPELYDQLAALHDRRADIHEKRSQELTNGGLGGQHALDTTAAKERGRADAARESAANLRERQKAYNEKIREKMPSAEAKVADREALARKSGKQADVDHAVAGHEEISRYARAAGMDDVADKHDALAQKLKDDVASGALKPAKRPTRSKVPGQAGVVSPKLRQEREDAQKSLDRVNQEIDRGDLTGDARENALNSRRTLAQRVLDIDAYTRAVERANEASAQTDVKRSQGNHQLAADANYEAAKLAEKIDPDARSGFSARWLYHQAESDRLSKSKVPGLTEEGAKEPKVDLGPYGQLHPADVALQHSGWGMDTAQLRTARTELERRGATEGGRDKISQAHRRVTEQLARSEAADRAYNAPGGRGEYDRTRTEAHRLGDVAQAEGTSAAHQAAANAYGRAATLAYKHDYNNGSKLSELSRMHAGLAASLKAKEGPTPEEKREQYKTLANLAPHKSLATSELRTPERLEKDADLHRRAAALAPTDKLRDKHLAAAQAFEDSAKARRATQAAEEAQQAKEREARATYQAARDAADQATAKARGKRDITLHEKAAELHQKAAEAATEDYQRKGHTATAEAHERAIATLQSKAKDADKPDADKLSAKATRSGTRADHARAANAQYAAGNRVKGDKHKSAVESIDESDEYKEEAEEHAAAAEHTQDPEAHEAAAKAYENAAEYMDDVPGGKKAAAALRTSAQEHTAKAQDIRKRTAEYVKRFTTATRASNVANRTGNADDRRSAAAAHRLAAQVSLTAAQRRHHEAEAADQERQARTA